MVIGYRSNQPWLRGEYHHAHYAYRPYAPYGGSGYYASRPATAPGVVVRPATAVATATAAATTTTAAATTTVGELRR
ncbi:MAG: hypothetical protein WKG07_08985 [Hymenobacter sp.]